MNTLHEQYQMEIFHDLPAEEMEWLIAHNREMRLETGDYFYRIGDMPEGFYVVLEGELQVSSMVNGELKVMGTTPRGIIGGEIPVLYGSASPVNSRAIMPTTLMFFDTTAFRQIFAYAPTFGARVLRIAAERMSSTASMAVQQAKMAALGKLSAGLAHELNNPAAAARRAASTLHEMLPQLQTQTLNLSRLNLTDAQIKNLITLQKDAIVNAGDSAPLSPIERSDREDALSDWLEAHEVPNAWDIAPTFINAGVTPDDMDELAQYVREENLPTVTAWLATALNAGALLCEIHETSERISDLVKAVKEYTYMDQGTVQEVDIHHGLEATLRVMKHKLRDVEVVRHYDPDLPKLMGRGGELNQVWTNLIDNAVYAMSGAGELKLITRNENEFVMIEVTDSGPGIPEDVLPHLFEPFYSTKPQGEGTGLGLDMVYRIIQGHQGTIEARSEPGNTRFIVRLPLSGVK